MSEAVSSATFSGSVAEPVSSFGDNALVAAYLEGNERAFEVLVGRHQKKLINYLSTIIRDYDTAVDLAQEAFIRIYRNARRYRGQYQFSTWLYRIATNLAIDEIRRRRRRGMFSLQNVLDWFQGEDRLILLSDRRPTPEKSLDRKETLQRLLVALESIPEKYRLAFVLKEVQEMSYEETAGVLDISPGTAKSRVHRAKMLLREKLSGVL